MKSSDNTIKEVEQYFLGLSGRGIMLSSMDYHIISGWIEKGLSKQQILTGIRNAFQSQNIRNIADCVKYVESEKEDRSEMFTKKNEESSDSSDYLTSIINNFNDLVSSTPGISISDFYSKYSDELKKLINTGGDQIFTLINKLEDRFFKELPGHLSQEDFKNYQTQINNFLSSRNDYINEKSKNKALNNFSKNFIIDNYLDKNPFEI